MAATAAQVQQPADAERKEGSGIEDPAQSPRSISESQYFDDGDSFGEAIRDIHVGFALDNDILVGYRTPLL